MASDSQGQYARFVKSSTHTVHFTIIIFVFLVGLQYVIHHSDRPIANY